MSERTSVTTPTTSILRAGAFERTAAFIRTTASMRTTASARTVVFAWALACGALLLPEVGLPLPTGATPASAQMAEVDPDTVQPGRFNFGKMWTFEYPPTEYFSTTYGFDADARWFETARMAALRIPGCSASFVSPAGLVVTNHHCARGAISRVSGPGEALLDDGFYARATSDERRIPNYYADQLVAVEDVSDEVFAAVDAVPPEERARAREAATVAIRQRLMEEHAAEDPHHVEVVALYHGGRYSAYVFRRFTDVRLVAAVELQAGFFGGDPDNFTYPRYAMDFAFYRVYDDGEPYEPERWFEWGQGVEEGDAVFVIGNPGPTNRLRTVAQLGFDRDVFVPVRIRYFDTRLDALREAYAADPERGEELGLRNRAFSLSNSLKAYTGRLAALEDPVIMARKRAAERELGRAIDADPGLRAEYDGVLHSIAGIQEQKRDQKGPHGAFYQLGHPDRGSRTLRRGLLAGALAVRREAGAPADSLARIRETLRELDDHPAGLEETLLTLRLEDLRIHLGEEDPMVREVLGGRAPEEAARAILDASTLATRERTAEMLESGEVPLDDPVLQLLRDLLPRLQGYGRHAAALAAEETELEAELGRARFEVYGTRVAPDATFSPRITDGVVKGYAYNGTVAPPYTTMYGIYDHYHSYGPDSDWRLPPSWLPAPPELDLSTPVNFVSTADTYGGNSGSPAVTKDLAIVGLNFDRNIEGLSRDFIYLPERGRNIMVDVRAIEEALDVIYDADRVVLELKTGRLVPTEAEADAVTGRGR